MRRVIIAGSVAILVIVAACGEPSETTDDPGSQGELLAAASVQLLTVDNSFEPGHRFDHVFVVDHQSDGTPLSDPERATIEAAIGEFSTVEFVTRAEDFMTDDLRPVVPGGAILTVGPIAIAETTATVEMALWCGGLCGVFLTYQAELGPEGWAITGTVGPIAVS